MPEIPDTPRDGDADERRVIAGDVVDRWVAEMCGPPPSDDDAIELTDLMEDALASRDAALREARAEIARPQTALEAAETRAAEWEGGDG